MSQYRYWTYCHDAEGEMVEDIAENHEFSSAVDDAMIWLTERLSEDPDFANSHTIRVVDHDDPNLPSVWLMGPVKLVATEGYLSHDPQPGKVSDPGNHFNMNEIVELDDVSPAEDDAYETGEF